MTESEFIAKKFPEIIYTIGYIFVREDDKEFSRIRELIFENGGWYLSFPSPTANEPVLIKFAVNIIKEEMRRWLAERGISIRIHNRDGKLYYVSCRHKRFYCHYFQRLDQLYFNYTNCLYAAIAEEEKHETEKAET